MMRIREHALRCINFGLIVLSSCAMGASDGGYLVKPKSTDLHEPELHPNLERLNKLWNSGPDNLTMPEIITGMNQCKWILRETPKLHECYDLTGKVLGRGGSGVIVLEATAARDDVIMMYAIKKISKSHIKHSKRRKEYEKLRNEVLIMSTVKAHPNIIDLEEVFEDDEYLYLVMEHCSGGDLHARIVKSEGGFDEEYAAWVLKKMLRAVRYCHQMKIAHFDLKPENFVFKTNDEYSELKLIDFGFAWFQKDDEKQSTKSGTPVYMAPEVVKTWGRFIDGYNKAADMWSIGVIAYFMIFKSVLFWKPKKDGKFWRNILRGFDNAIRPKGWKIPCFKKKWVEKQNVTDECLDFIGKCLVGAKSKIDPKSPEERITAAKALQHSWIVHARRRASHKTPKEVEEEKTVDDI